MDTNGWRSAQSGVEPTMDTGSSGTDWRTQLPPDTRQRLVNKIMDTLKRHLPFSGQEGLQQLEQIASRFEEKIYAAATSQSDYVRKISLKILTMETKSQNTMATIIPVNSASNSKNPPDAALLDSTTQTENANNGDWQEEVYQKANLTTLQSSSNMLQHQMMHPQLQQLYQQRLQHLLLQLHQQRQQQLQQLHQQTQQVNINSLSSQSGMNALQANPTPLPANPASNSENPLDEGIYALEDIIRLLEI